MRPIINASLRVIMRNRKNCPPVSSCGWAHVWFQTLKDTEVPFLWGCDWHDKECEKHSICSFARILWWRLLLSLPFMLAISFFQDGIDVFSVNGVGVFWLQYLKLRIWNLSNIFRQQHLSLHSMEQLPKRFNRSWIKWSKNEMTQISAEFINRSAWRIRTIALHWKFSWDL